MVSSILDSLDEAYSLGVAQAAGAVKGTRFNRGLLLDMPLGSRSTRRPTFGMTLRDRGQSRKTDIRIRSLGGIHFS